MKRRVFTDVATAPGHPLAYVTGGELCLPPDAPQTLIAALVAAAKRAPRADIRCCLTRGERLDISFAELLAQAERIACGLRERNITAGECVIVLLDANQQILPAFWGCLLSGTVPVIAGVPADLSEGSRALGQLFATWTHLGQPEVVVADGHQELHAALTCQGGISAERLATFESLLSHERDDRHHAAQPDDVAFLSLTSGSTGRAKCVELTHHNVLSRAHGTNQLGRHTASDVILNWLPLDHIGSLSDWHLRCVLLGCTMVYVAKEEILARPLSWLELVEEHCITHSWAPNFAYGLLADAVARESSRQWNLSSVKGLVTAGENVSPSTIRRTLELLGPCGLAASAIRPAFGMAEMASGVTYSCGTRDLESITTEGGKTTSLASLGPPIPGIELRIVDETQQVVAEETVGQLQVRGEAVSRGYYRSPEARQAFHADGWFDTGDLGFLSDGELYLTGRAKDTIIVRGANFSCAQIEDVVQSVAGVESSFTAACPVRNGSAEESLAIFFHTRVTGPGEIAALLKAIRREVVRQVGVNPEYLLPVDHQAISKTAIGKIQRQQLKHRFEQGEFDDLLANVNAWLRAAQPNADAATPQTDIERQVADIWKEVLGLDSVSLHQNVFELGAHSLLLAQVHQRLQAALACQLSIVEMFKYPTIHQLAQRLSGETNQQGPVEIGQQQAQRRLQASAEVPTGVAVIGMAGRFPGAVNLDQFWWNLRNGVESIARFTESQVLEAGIDPARARDPKYVKAGPVLDGVEQFDAEFFGYTAREAELMDPQQRLLLECSWEAMENAGYNLLAYDGTVGVYAGALLNTYLLNNVLPGKRHLAEGEQSAVLTPDSLAGFLTMVASDKDYLTTRVSYKLNLRGPSINVQTACSTSLVAVHMAAESVLAGQCDLALAGGVSVKVPQEAGYLYEDDLIVSSDGHCRPMDAAASGTVFGNGCGVVVLKRLDRAIADRDHIFAVIRSSAVNNDGARKVGYMAPSQDGQAAVVAEAIARAGIEPESIGFIEAHGTATALGDPIEVAGLVDAFRSGTGKSSFCALGSVKSNVGHLQIASGIAGFIKAVLALYHKQIPPSLHFEKPNPRIDFSQSPFFVNSRLLEWPNGSEPRRAGVNSLGIGGTNAHVILEEPPAPAVSESRVGREQLLVLSATSKPALRELAGRYADYLNAHGDVSLVDLCYTANGGRVPFAQRAVFVAGSIDELREQLKAVAAGQDAVDLKASAHGNDRVLQLRNLAERFAAGLPVDWEPLFQGDHPRRVPLPTYPFQRKRYWIDRPKKSLPRKLLQPVGENTFEAVLDPSAWPALHEHRLCGQPVVPGALQLALMLDAAREVAGGSCHRVENIRFQHLLPLAAEMQKIVSVGLRPVIQGWTTEVRDAGAERAARTWASGQIVDEAAEQLPAWALAVTRIDQVRSRCPRKMSGDDFYRRLDLFDVQLGAAFQSIAHIDCGQHEALARIRLVPASRLDCDTQMQPVLLDGALQLAPALFDLRETQTQIPTGIQAFTLLQQCRETELWCYVRLQPNHAKSGLLVVDALLLDDTCQPVALLEGISYQGVARERLLQLVAKGSEIKTLPSSSISANGSAPNRQRALTDFIRQEVSKALGLRGGQPLPADRGFSELGLDSLTSVELRNRLQQRLGCSLPATVVFDYPTINQLVAMLLARPDVKLPTSERAAAIPAASNGKPKAAPKSPPIAPLPYESPHAAPSDSRQERFAIVGMSCRFPGGSNSPQEFWEFLERGGDASRDVPSDRFDIEAYYHADRTQPGTIATRRGCFLDNIDQFDAAHFGIAPREAHTLDPQQRLLLEVAHAAIENAGVPINSLDGSGTGVFVGMSGIDYAILSSRDPKQIGPYLGTGTAHATACGRLSYVLGLQGPCLSVDTACSSSLVAVHLACQSLARGECDLALAAGVNLVTAPQIMISFSKAQMLSADGRCKTFDASADGYVRGEGVGVLVLKRLSAAIRDHDRILAVIRGTAVNQDGKSSGLTVPSGPAQEKVIRSALAAAGVAPAQVSYIEAHGTGTPLGDSIELGALRNVYSAGRANPLMVGSVKTNIGHTEAVSGMAGLIKVVLALEHQQIPRHLHFETPNPHVEWDGMVVPTECLPWISMSGPRLAGVSSFGFGGTNAHVVVEQAPASVAGRAAISVSERPFQVLAISAKSANALNRLSSRYREHLLLPETGWEATCAAAALARAHWPHRLAVVAASNEDAAAKLESFAAAGNLEVIRGDVSESAPPVALLFSGQGSQYAGMGRELYETEPTFRRSLDRCDEILRPYLPSSLLAALFPTDSDPRLLDQTAFTQPALFALEYSLWELWKSWGLAPSVLLGHSVGEYVAACAAGVFDLEDGLRLIATRGRLVQSLPAGGAMCAVMASAEWVELALAQVDHQAGMAAINGPRQVVVSGRREAVETVARAAEAAGIRVQMLTVSHAFHSHLLDPILDEFYAVASSVTFRRPTLPIISNWSGDLADADLTTPEYWCQHLRHPVQFARGIQTAAIMGCELFVEAGPQATLAAMGRQCLPDGRFRWLPSLGKSGADWKTMLTSLATLHVSGVPMAWDKIYDQRLARQQTLPTYPFQRQRYWLPEPSNKVVSINHDAAKAVHPLLGHETRLPGGGAFYESRIGATSPAFLADHQVQGRPLFPGAGFVEALVAAGQRLLRSPRVQLRDVEFVRALPLSAEQSERVEIQITPANAEFQAQFFRRVSSADDEPTWTLHAASRIGIAPVGEAPLIDLGQLQSRLSHEQSTTEFYHQASESGLEYGPAFQRLTGIWRGQREALGCFDSSPAIAAQIDDYTLHPALLDAAFQVVGVLLPSATDGTYLPVGAESIEVFGRLPASGYSHVRLRDEVDGHGDLVLADLDLIDSDGHVIARIAGFRLKRVRPDAFRPAPKQQPDECLYELAWRQQAQAEKPPFADEGNWLIAGGDLPLTRAVASGLRANGQVAVAVESASSLAAMASEMSPPPRGVIFLASDFATTEIEKQNGHASPGGEPRLLTETALHLVQSLVSRDLQCRLYLVTRGAVAASEGEAVPGVAQSPLWGMGGVIATEHPELRCTRIDLDPSSEPTASAESLVAELVAADGEDRVALRSTDRFVARLKSYQPPATEVLPLPDGPYRLQLTEFGVLENLQLAPLARRLPAPHEVEIAVAAAGLNFRDVLRALGMLRPFESSLGITDAADAPFGFECAGTIAAVGQGITDFAVGDEVVGVALGSMRSHVMASIRQVAPKPANLSLVEAATLPLAFLTASHALEQLASLQPGAKVLIHAAAGGVGLAAVQLALARGAEVFATASPPKWDFLRTIGVKHIFNSRTLDFSEEISRQTDGQGVDVVLNSLTGDFIAASLKCLRREGVFVEIGKLGIWSPDQMAVARPDVRYFAFDLGEEEAREPGMMGRLLKDVLRRMEQGELTPLPHRAFPLTAARQAFRLVAQARHRGKVVLTLTEPPSKLSLRPDGWYLITGGLGALGLKTAEWLIEQGARQLVLLGRTTPQSETQLEALTRLREKNADVQFVQADVANRDALAEALKQIPGPLCGVIHAAGVLDDGMLHQLDRSRLAKVLAPKVNGAWNLHELTRGQPLDFFVCFSSAAALLGSPGQANYAAANAFLDSLVHHRRALGLPALSVNWGPWAEGGMAARLSDRERQRLDKMGFEWIDSDKGFRLLGQLLADDAVQAAVLPIDWPRYLSSSNSEAAPFYQEVLDRHPRQPQAPAPSILVELQSADDGERNQLMVDYLRSEIAAVLGFDPKAISPRSRLFDLGMDSLTAVELQNRMQRGLSIDMPTTLAFDYPTPSALSEYLLDRLGLAISTDEQPDVADAALTAQVEQYTDDEVETLLREKYQDVLKEQSS